jgi:hypothetical protein
MEKKVCMAAFHPSQPSGCVKNCTTFCTQVLSEKNCTLSPADLTKISNGRMLIDFYVAPHVLVTSLITVQFHALETLINKMS